MKLCECGCGQETPIATRNEYRRGHVKGQPIRFLPGHHNHHSALLTATEKLCPKCKRTLPIASFQRDARNVYQARCRECRREDQRNDSNGHLERTRRYRMKNRAKFIAHCKVNAAVKRGELQPVTQCICVLCGNQAKHYHHESYDRPLDVTPVCSACHKLIHMEREYA